MVDYELQLVEVPVSDVDRAKEFYRDRVGFREDHDGEPDERTRFVQLTPPGSACSICIGRGLSGMTPGSSQGLMLVVKDIHEARADLAARGVEVTDVDVQEWGSFVYFADPDGNGWAVQQLPPRG